MSDDAYIDVGKILPRDNEELPDRHEKTPHPYYCYGNGLEFMAIINNWRKAKGGFKCAVTLDCQRLNSTPKTVYQKLYHGRKWVIQNGKDLEIIEHCRSIKIQQLREVIKLSYNPAGAIVDTMAQAMQFGEEAVDVQAQFLDWMATNPPDGETWPTEDIILEDDDVAWFLDAKKKMAAQATPRFIVTLKGNKVKVTSIIV